MPTYSLAFNPDRSTYEVEMQDDAGGRAVFGFQTEAAARKWIAEDRHTNSCGLPDAESKAQSVDRPPVSREIG
jgi:hypothetical protein